MKEKLLSYFAAAKPYIQKAYSASPFFLGLAVGYLGHGPLKLAFGFVSAVFKGLF